MGETSKAGKDQKQMEGPRRVGGSPLHTPLSALATLAENSGSACWMERTDGQSAKGTLERANSQHLSRVLKPKPADSNHRLLDRQQLGLQPGHFWPPPPCTPT